MLDIKFIREHPDLVRDALRKRGEDLSVIDDILALDERRKKQLQGVETHRADQRVLSKEIGKLQQDKQKTPASGARVKEMIDNMRNLSDEITNEEQELRVLEDNLRTRMLEIPNLPDQSVPEGKNSADNLIVRTWGERASSHSPRPHWEIGENHVDRTRRQDIGTRFYVLRGLGARLERALISSRSTNVRNTAGVLPFMVKKNLIGSGNLQDLETTYTDVSDDTGGCQPLKYRDQPAPRRNTGAGHIAVTTWPIHPASTGKMARQKPAASSAVASS